MNHITGKNVRFIADAMLKKLAKYLRALGYDTLFDESLPDESLRKKSVQAHRILLTRDQELYETTPARYAFYVEPRYPEKQIKAVAKKYNLTLDESRFMTRCLECNIILQKLNKSELPGKVPSRVYTRHETFYYCRSCTQIFWQGDHVKRLRMKLSHLIAETDP